MRNQRLSRGEALILVLLLSLGFWAAIWGAVGLLAIMVGGEIGRTVD
jgi:hypothetical protein